MSIATHEASAECVEGNNQFHQACETRDTLKESRFAIAKNTVKYAACFTRSKFFATSFYRFRFAAPVANDIGVCSAHFLSANF